MENSNAAIIEKHTNWLDLPFDVTLMILIHLSPFEILDSVQFVCKLWCNLCKDPSLWRTIHIREVDVENIDSEKMFLKAIDRSAGCLIDLDIEDFSSNKLLSYVASQSSQLKRLRLARFHCNPGKAVEEAVAKLHTLEELELTGCSFQDGKDIISIIKSCPSLTTFKLNKVDLRTTLLACDDAALAIAESMPELRHLQLIGNGLTNDGLTAILDGCPRLHSLDLRASFHLDLKGKLEKRLSKHIKDFQGPNESTEDYKYCSTCIESDHYCYFEYSSDDSTWDFESSYDYVPLDITDPYRPLPAYYFYDNY